MRTPAARPSTARPTDAARSCRHACVAGKSEIERAGDDVVLGDIGAAQLAQDTSLIKNGNTVAAADQLVVIRAVKQDGGALVGKFAQQLIDLLLGSTIDSACRIVEQDDARRGH